MRVFNLFMAISIAMGVASTAQAQGLSIIRDTEIEQTLEQWSAPVLEQAGLGPEQVHMAVVNSDEVNAFVAGGANIFIYAGLIQAADYPEEVIGVIAHETGHIEGGHLIAGRRAMERASYQSMLAMIIGLGAAAATGDGGAAGVVGAGGSSMAMRGFLSHSRTQESSADQAAIRYMEGAKINPNGLVSFLEKLEGQELLPASQQSQYMRTHPLTRDRIEAMRTGAAESVFSTAIGTSPKQHKFDLIRAKLRGFLQPHLVPRYYNGDADTNPNLYAYAIMYYQQKNFVESIEILNRLISSNPKSPYFIEMKAQVLRDSGDLKQAEALYKKALSMVKYDAPLIEIALAHVMIEQQKSTDEVEKLLLSALQKDEHNPRTFRLLATIKGRQDKESDAQYYLAEEASSLGNKPEARRLLDLSLKNNNLSKELTVKAQDLKIYLDSLPRT